MKLKPKIRNGKFIRIKKRAVIGYGDVITSWKWNVTKNNRILKTFKKKKSAENYFKRL